MITLRPILGGFVTSRAAIGSPERTARPSRAGFWPGLMFGCALLVAALLSTPTATTSAAPELAALASGWPTAGPGDGPGGGSGGGSDGGSGSDGPSVATGPKGSSSNDSSGGGSDAPDVAKKPSSSPDADSSGGGSGGSGSDVSAQRPDSVPSGGDQASGDSPPPAAAGPRPPDAPGDQQQATATGPDAQPKTEAQPAATGPATPPPDATSSQQATVTGTPRSATDPQQVAVTGTPPGATDAQQATVAGATPPTTSDPGAGTTVTFDDAVKALERGDNETLARYLAPRPLNGPKTTATAAGTAPGSDSMSLLRPTATTTPEDQALKALQSGDTDALAQALAPRPVQSPTDPAAVTGGGPAPATPGPNVALFRSVTGHDPLTPQDWRTAQTLDPAFGESGEGAIVGVARINKVPNAGQVYGDGFIQDHDVLSVPDTTHFPQSFSASDLGDNRGFDPTVGPQKSRMAFMLDFENGVAVVRQNPTHSTGGDVGVRPPEVGVEQDPAGRTRLRLQGTNGRVPDIANKMGVTVRGDLIVDPHGGPHRIPSVDGAVSQYPSWEAYHSVPGQPPSTVLQREQNDKGKLYGPLVNLPLHSTDVGQHPEALDQWRQRYHPDQIDQAARESVVNPFRELRDPDFHDYPLPPVPPPTPDGHGGITIPEAGQVK